MKKSFVMTGYVQRNTCNCGCVSSNTFWQDNGFGGSSHLSHLHAGIAKFLDELSGAGPGEQGKPHDVKVTVTIESLDGQDHRVLNRHSFSGLGYEDNIELKRGILAVEEPVEVSVLNGADALNDAQELREAVSNLNRTISVDYLQDMHDRMLLARRSSDFSKLDDLMVELQRIVNRDS